MKKYPLHFPTVFSVLFIYQVFISQCGFCADKPVATTSLASIEILKDLSPKNKYYTIDETVHVASPYYRFLVKSPHGDYDVTSIRDLFKVCHEIRIIEEYRATDQGSQAWKGASESVKNIGRGAKQIVKEPKESAKAFARAGGKLMRSIGRFIKKKTGKEDEKKSGDGTDRDKGGEGLFSGKHARQFASEVGLDVYTDNPYAQALIQEVAKARSKGTIGTSVGMFFLAPVQGLGLLSNSLTPNGFNAEIERLIRDEDPAELRYVLAERYKKELGFAGEAEGDEGIPIKTLLDNPNYSPREQSYLYYYLRCLVKPESGAGVTDFQAVIDSLGKMSTPDAATSVTNQMELLSAYQAHVKDLTKFTTVSQKIGAVTGKKEMLFILPYDFADNTSEMQKFLDEVAASAQKQGVKKIQLWFTGKSTSDLIAKAKARGITVKENILLLPYFAPKVAFQPEQTTK